MSDPHSSRESEPLDADALTPVHESGGESAREPTADGAGDEAGDGGGNGGEPPVGDGPAPKRPSHVPAVWIALLVMVALVAGVNVLSQNARQQQRRTVPPDAQLVFAGRMVVAMHHLGQLLPAFQLEQTSEQAVRQMRRLAREQPVDQVRVAMIFGELKGPDAARRILNHIEEPGPAVRRDMDALRTLYAYESDESSAGAAHGVDQAHDVPLDTAAQQRLIDRHHWFGRLALTFRQPLSQTQRSQVMYEARRAFWTVITGIALLAFVGLAGLVLFIVALAMAAAGKLKSHFTPPAGWHVPLLETVPVFLALMLGVLVLSVLVQVGFGINIGPVLQLLVLPLALLWPLARGMDWAQLRNAMGWHKGEGAAWELGAGLVGYVAGMPILALGLGGTVLLGRFSEQDAAHPIVDQLQTGGWSAVALIIAMAVIWAPLVEESLFRGSLYYYLRRGWGMLAAALAAGFLFAAIHPQGWVGVPVITALGVVLALIREWRGTMIAAATAHAVHNLVSVSMMFLLLR